jgi:hypothetical protein
MHSRGLCTGYADPWRESNPRPPAYESVFLNDDDLDAGACQEIAEHEPGGAAADNAAARLHSLLAGSQGRRHRDLVLRTHGVVHVLPVGASCKMLKKA